MECTSFPSPEQIALALAIVKLKPVGLDIREYILQTRQFIQDSRNTEISHSPEKFFDSVSFWKQAYEKSEAEQSKLLDRIYELEQRNETLLAKVQARDVDSPIETPAQGSSKRKATRNPTVQKRAKTQVHPAVNSSGADVRASSDDVLGQMAGIREATGPFMRQFYILQKVLQKRPNNSNIVQAAVSLCKTADDEVVSAFLTSNVSKGRSRKGAPTRTQLSHLGIVLRGVECAVGLLFQALKRLTGTESHRREAGLLTYHLVCLYETTMKALEQYCKTRCEQACAESKAKTKSSRQKRTTAKSKHANTTGEPDVQAQSQSEDEGARQFTSLLDRMISLVELTCPQHQSLLEGLLYVLLSRVGKFLSLFVFQDLQLRPDLRIDPAKLSLPAGLADVELDDKALAAAKMESRHLIWLLERALAVLDNYPSMSDSARSDGQSDRGQFASRIKARLQSTLAQAVFGDNPTFGSTLQRYTLPDDQDLDKLRECHQLPEQSVPDWFIQEVWRLLGWEVLMSEPSME